MEGMPIITPKSDGHRVFEAFTGQLDRYESLLTTLEMKAAPFISGPGSDSRAVPEEAPVNEYQRLVNRLTHLNHRFNEMIDRIQA